MLSQPIQDATNVKKGVIRIATDSEATTGTAEDISINPKQLKAAIVANGLIKVFQFTGVLLQVTYSIAHNLGTNNIVPISIKNTSANSGAIFTGYSNTNVNTLSVTIPLASVSAGVVYDVICVVYP